MSKELKPCPFCGGEATLEQLLNDKDDHIISCCNEECNTTCIAMTLADMTKSKAISVWNTRSEQSPFQWTKTPPGEKYIGKWFVLRYVNRSGNTRYDVITPIEIKSQDLIYRGYYTFVKEDFQKHNAEFLGPLPE